METPDKTKEKQEKGYSWRNEHLMGGVWDDWKNPNNKKVTFDPEEHYSVTSHLSPTSVAFAHSRKSLNPPEMYEYLGDSLDGKRGITHHFRHVTNRQKVSVKAPDGYVAKKALDYIQKPKTSQENTNEKEEAA